ncbi:MAG: hypothetical protein Kow00129_03610 [Thermoleophilia bacterium]
MADNPLLRLKKRGQSVWYDNIERDLLLSGGLSRMVREDGIAGVTSNPTIFQKAVSGSDHYDDAIREMIGLGLDTAEILDALVAQDIAAAADILRPTFEATATVDGWVSIEVPASMAYDPEATLAEVGRLRTLVDRPNVLVKIPGTKEGIDAIRTSIARGHSINITLIFSLERYGEVIEAYMAGLEELIERREAGEDLPEPRAVRSVASFFVSRVDTKVDGLLEKQIGQADRDHAAELSALRGKAAIANAKLAYQMFLEAFKGERWEKLALEGALVQRPLWASTSTKNPEYRDVLYVEELIGPDTVNTMPQETVDAFRDHGEVRGDTVLEDVDAARRSLEALEEHGISMAQVTAELEVEGVKKFADSFDELYEAVEAKRSRIAETVGR